MKQKMVLVASVIIGLVAFFMTGQYLKSERDKLYAGAAKVMVLVAKRDLSVGTVLSLDDVAQSSVFKSAVGGNVCIPDDLDSILGKRLNFSIARLDPIFWSDIENADASRGGLAATVKSGMRALSISAGGPAAVSGLIQPNDHIDILGTFTFPSKKSAGDVDAVTLTMLQDVTVLATGTRMSKSTLGSGWNQAAGSYSSVTLEVTPSEAEVLVFAEHAKGQLLLTLRNKDDVTYEKDLPEVNFQHIEEKLPDLNNFRQQNIRHNRPL